jgi:putative transposase
LIISKGYKTEINPNKTQEVLLNKAVGTARWVYNWGLNRKIQEYKVNKKSISAMDLHKEIVQLKKTEEFKWLKEISKCVPQESLRNLDVAYDNFFRNCKQGKKEKGFPKFKKKHSSKQSCKFNSLVKVKEDRIFIPRIGWIRLKEKGYIPTNVLSFNLTVSKRVNRWFVSVKVKENINDYINLSNDEIKGIDIGCTVLGVTSDNTVYNNPKALRRNERKLKRQQRQLSKKVKGSKNRFKAKDKLAKTYFRVSNIRKDAIHKMTSDIVKTKPFQIVIEDLAVSNILKNHKLAKSISDASFGEIKRQLEYKCLWNGIELIKADRFFPSSKLCSNCGNKKEDLTLSDRVYVCDVCGLVIDRDLNASINLKSLRKKPVDRKPLLFGMVQKASFLDESGI